MMKEDIVIKGSEDILAALICPYCGEEFKTEDQIMAARMISTGEYVHAHCYEENKV